MDRYSASELGIDFKSSLTHCAQTGFVMAVYGAFDATGSVLLGRMADVMGKRFSNPAPVARALYHDSHLTVTGFI